MKGVIFFKRHRRLKMIQGWIKDAFFIAESNTPIPPIESGVAAGGQHTDSLLQEAAHQLLRYPARKRDTDSSYRIGCCLGA